MPPRGTLWISFGKGKHYNINSTYFLLLAKSVTFWPFLYFCIFFFLCQKVANELKIFNHTCFYLYRKHSKCTVHWCKEHNFSFLIINNCSPCLKQFQIYCVLNSCVWQKFDQIIKIFGFITSKTDIEGSNSVTDIHQVHKIINK